MTMYEELRGDLAAWATHFHFNDETSLLLCKAADAIEDLVKKHEAQRENLIALMNAHDWIPVTERLPEESGHYLVVDDGDVVEAYYGKDWGSEPWSDPIEMYMTYHPTHWTPLPKPPKEGVE